MGKKILDQFRYRLLMDRYNSITIFVDTETFILTVTSSRPINGWPDLELLPAAFNERIYAEGDTITTFCEGTTKITVTAVNTYPYVDMDIELSSNDCGYNGGGGGCTLTIEEVKVVDDDSAEIHLSGVKPGDSIQYSVDGVSGWQTSPFFDYIGPGVQVARAKNQYGCSASLQFVIVGPGQVALRIDSVDAFNEQSEYASDGHATVNAVTTFGVLQFSLDNLNWQLSNQFFNLAPGNYTVYVKDDLSAKSENFTIEPFFSFIESTPGTEMPNGNTSRWVAIHNPLLFRFRRSDYTIIGILNVGNRPQLVLDHEPQGISVGGYIAVRSEKYSGVFKVYSTSGNTVTIDTLFLQGNSSSGKVITNIKPNYRMEIKVVTGISKDKEINIGTFTADTMGLVVTQIQSKLKNLVNNKNEFTYDRINWRDLNAAASFEIYYREIWDGSLPEYSKIPEVYYFVNAAKQIGDKFGNNMAEYVTFPSYSVNVTKAKFLTSFEVPTYFVGYPFDLSFIYSENIIGHSLLRSETLLDVNSNPFGVGNHTVLSNQDGPALLNQDNAMVLIEEGYEGFTPISQALGVHRLMLSPDLLNNTAFKSVALGYYEGDEFNTVTESKKVKINNDCRKFPVYLCWVNTLGGWDYWLFESTQKIDLTTANVKTYDVYNEDLLKASATTETISKEAFEKITLGAVAEKDEFVHIRNVIMSPKVLLLIGQTPVKWVTVQIEQTSLSYQSKDEQIEFDFSILLPALNIQTN
ncbi:hypothetical protein BCY91_14110 [Pelobium manganitolerans]|uniref:Uncharacterized protein n=1 Tax=Pelobium manganitolerans TaxID=1842495 RepID=A0A419S9Y1_9SPHI|nr:hypothetical protein [Pelobium manganitolerans]RKD19007.1 hypothetical protein BCY91_14110 [Pelobium manganitolerans]